MGVLKPHLGPVGCQNSPFCSMCGLPWVIYYYGSWIDPESELLLFAMGGDYSPRGVMEPESKLGCEVMLLSHGSLKTTVGNITAAVAVKGEDLVSSETGGQPDQLIPRLGPPLRSPYVKNQTKPIIPGVFLRHYYVP